jgi:8-oxo-dGTP diphosphatase
LINFDDMENAASSQSSVGPQIIDVACSIIEGPEGVLCALRSATMSLPLVWEFPGGKIEPGESAQAALVREIREELAVMIEVLQVLPVSDHSYVPGRLIRLHPFVCRITSEASPVAGEHAEIRWIRKEDLRSLDWAAADVPVLEHYLNS